MRARRGGAARPTAMPVGSVQVMRLGAGGIGDLLALTELFDHPLDKVAAREYLARPENLLLVAYRSGRPVGYLRGTALRQLHTRRPQMFLYEIAVLPRHQRQGVGRTLVEALLAYCRTNDFEEAFVLTDDPANVAAHGLYLATGGVTETVGERMYVYRFPRERSPADREPLRPRPRR